MSIYTQAASPLAGLEPVVAVTVLGVYDLVHAEVSSRITEVFLPGSDAAPPDDQAFHALVYTIAGWTWFTVGDTALAQVQNVLGLSDPYTALAVEAAVKAHVVEAFTTLRDLAEDPQWCEAAVGRDDLEPPEILDVATTFMRRLADVLDRPEEN